MTERSSEGAMAPSGLDPNPVAHPRPEDGDPQTYELVLDKLCRKLGLDRTVYTDLDSIIAVFGIDPQTPTPTGPPETPAAYLTDPATAATEAKAHDKRSIIKEAAGEYPSNGATFKIPGFTNQAMLMIQKAISERDLDAPAGFEILSVCLDLASFLMGKNRKYGDAALNPVRIMSSADPAEQLRVRMDDKLSRLLNRQADEDEDVLKDLVGYWVLMRIAEGREG